MGIAAAAAGLALVDVKGFHAALLTDGALPMDVVEAKVQRWADSVR